MDQPARVVAIDVKDEKGVRNWAIEFASPNSCTAAAGVKPIYRRSTVTVTGYPSRDSSRDQLDGCEAARRPHVVCGHSRGRQTVGQFVRPWSKVKVKSRKESDRAGLLDPWFLVRRNVNKLRIAPVVGTLVTIAMLAVPR